MIFQIPQFSDIAASSSEQVPQVYAQLSPLLWLLAVPIGLVLLGLVVWAAKGLLYGAYRIITGKTNDTGTGQNGNIYINEH